MIMVYFFITVFIKKKFLFNIKTDIYLKIWANHIVIYMSRSYYKSTVYYIIYTDIINII